jgi:hypothetical protein
LKYNDGKSSARQIKQSKSEIILKAREKEIKEGRKKSRERERETCRNKEGEEEVMRRNNGLLSVHCMLRKHRVQ